MPLPQPPGIILNWRCALPKSWSRRRRGQYETRVGPALQNRWRASSIFAPGADRALEGRGPNMDFASFLQDAKTSLLRPCLTHVVGQFTGAQAGDGISTGPYEAHIHNYVMAHM
jgi:hypothetical protein